MFIPKERFTFRAVARADRTCSKFDVLSNSVKSFWSALDSGFEISSVFAISYIDEYLNLSQTAILEPFPINIPFHFVRLSRLSQSSRVPSNPFAKVSHFMLTAFY